METIYPDIRSDKPVPDWVYRRSIETVQEMLSSGLFVIGFLNPENGEKEFAPLTMSIDETIEFLRKEWKNGESAAFDIGYTCWFQASSKGEQLARELNLI